MNELAAARAQHWLDVGQPLRCLEVLADNAEVEDPATLERLRTSAFVDLRQWDSAVQSARRGLAHDPHRLDLVYLLALAVEEVGGNGHEESERLFIHGLSVEPHNVVFLTAYANLLTRFHELKKAGALIDRAASIQPESTQVYVARMQLAFAKGQRAKAAEWADKVLAEDPHNTGALAFGGAVESSRGRARQGSRRLRTAASQRLGDRDLASSARSATLESHPLMWPVRVMQRLPPLVAISSGVVAIGCVFALEALGATTASNVVLGVWLAFIAYYMITLIVLMVKKS